MIGQVPEIYDRVGPVLQSACRERDHCCDYRPEPRRHGRGPGSVRKGSGSAMLRRNSLGN